MRPVCSASADITRPNVVRDLDAGESDRDREIERNREREIMCITLIMFCLINGIIGTFINIKLNAFLLKYFRVILKLTQH